MKMTHRIGPWLFDVGEKVLRSTDNTHHLEDRTARTLAMLCDRRGQIVGKDEILASVWQGRTVSSNSVAIVIGDLRKALRDDPKAPVYIETVAQRGYRLTDEPEAPSTLPPDTMPPRTPGRFGSRAWIAAAMMAIVIMAAIVVASPSRRSVDPAVALTVDPTVNATGQASFDPLAVSIGTVVLERAIRLPHTNVLASSSVTVPADARRLRLQSKLILWNGVPEVALLMMDSRTGSIIWSRFATGSPGTLARSIAARVAQLQTLPR